MKKSIITIVGCIFLIIGFAGCGLMHKEQDELAFEYCVTDGKPVNPKDNPLLPYGVHGYIGWNTEIFRVTSQSHQYAMTAEITKSSPYDEAATFDSHEGATIKVNFTTMGHVENIWIFYDNFGNNQYKLSGEFSEIKDPRIYEAIREASHYAMAVFVEMAEDMSATTIKKSPDQMNKEATKRTREYMKQFGFYVDDIFLSGPITFPGGDAITTAYNTTGVANSEVEEARQDKEKMLETKKSMIDRGKREADKILSEASREANRLTAEAEAMAMDMKQSIAQIGLDNTIDLFVGRELAKLVKEGVIPEAVLTQDSVLGAPFYNKKLVNK
ncbi:MAG: hypothetical protein WC848_02895 [Parcubacteria group bacterium]|jgi:regulator of protease activity HflC (stomatin/prohibitin superfamily)